MKEVKVVIYVTGDTHGSIDIHKLNKKHFDDSKMTKNDYVIICGDCGLVWYEQGQKDRWWQKWLDRKKFTTLFVDGNHENHNMLDAMPVERWNGGKIHKVTDSIYHLMRGQVFHMNGLKFFTMGGAASGDKKYRKENVSWWAREMPSNEEYQEAWTNLEQCNWKVDYVLTHTAPSNIQSMLDAAKEQNQLTDFLLEVDKKLQYVKWYFGHFHDDKEIDERHILLYNKILKI